MAKYQKLTSEDLAELAGANSSILSVLAEWANKQLTCTHCKKCTTRCEILSEANLDMGIVEEEYRKLMALPEADRPAAVIALVTERPEIFIALRRCCFCGFCTAECAHHVLAPERMREWRELFMKAGYMPPDDSRIVMVDNEWHIFSAYRAIYGISYPEFTYLAQAAEMGPGHVDTLFFPGCSLVSYTPELTRKVGEWLTRAGISWALSDDCCGSPLMSAGLFDRAAALRQRIYDQARAAGIKRIVTVCPGCGEELAETIGDDIEIVPLPEILERYASRIPSEEGRPHGFSPLDEFKSFCVFDSCHDRADNRHGAAIRRLLLRYVPESKLREIDHKRKGTLCCGAGGAVSSYDPAITDKRTWRVIDEARKTKADTLVTMCPTCTYTIAQACLGADASRGVENHHYLELLFGETIDWPRIFDELGSMWTGEYGPWLTQTFYG